MILGGIERDQWHKMDQGTSKLNSRKLEKIFSDIPVYEYQKFILSCFSLSL